MNDLEGTLSHFPPKFTINFFSFHLLSYSLRTFSLEPEDMVDEALSSVNETDLCNSILDSEDNFIRNLLICINAGDVKKMLDAWICTCSGLMKQKHAKKIGMYEDNDEATNKSRLLSLELLQGLLEGVSHSFPKNFNFINSVKAYLSYALLRASVSEPHAIFQYATGTFLVLLLRFRENLRLIGISGHPKTWCSLVRDLSLTLTYEVAYEALDSPAYIYCGMLEKVCEDPLLLVDTVINHCDIETLNLFERVITTLSRMAQGIQNNDMNSVVISQPALVKGSLVQSLVSVLKSPVDREQTMKFDTAFSELEAQKIAER
ncbi:hypothetical protein OROGR_005663 [Orobanche gracilis]